jgi:hypothetical protein
MADDTDTPEIPEMVERVAEALFDGHDTGIPWQCAVDWFDAGPHQRRTDTGVLVSLCRFQAWLAIRAMREPTEKMLYECTTAFGEAIWKGKTFWEEMIDRALGK